MKMKKLEDFGRKIGGARKDLCAETETDAWEMSASDLARRASRARLWPAPDYRALLASGIPEDVVFRLKLLHERIPTRIVPRGVRWKWRFDFDIGVRRRAYIGAVLRLRDAAEGVRAWDDFRQVEDVYRSLDVESRWALDMVTDRDYARSFLDYLRPDRIVDYENSISEEDMLIEAKRKGWPVVAATSPRRKPEIIRRPLVENPERSGGPDIRRGRSIDPTDVMVLFGLHGVEFGNWVGAREQRRLLDLAVDALADLANLIGIATSGISLGGTLSLAFGARGSGGVKSAHYEPEKRVINLTRTRGAGALAHEWWHAFDDHLSRLSGVPELPASANGTSNDARIVAVREALAQVIYRFVDDAEFAQPTTFLANARKLDFGRSKPYYALPHELAARAFEAGVEAVLRDESGRRSDFLVAGTGNERLYPPPKDALNFFFDVATILREVLTGA